MEFPDMKEENTTADMEENEETGGEGGEQAAADGKKDLSSHIQDMNDKYVRLYAEFENYKRRVGKDKEELIKYGSETLLYELLPVIDHLDMALKHASNDVSSGLIQGVQITLKELKRTLEKFGLTEIDAEGKPFDPAVHHAMSQVERDDIEDNIVVEEFRKGYKLRDKVLRPSLVAVSKSTGAREAAGETETDIRNVNNVEEEC
jgi:molecular chaperone GrpE